MMAKGCGSHKHPGASSTSLNRQEPRQLLCEMESCGRHGVEERPGVIAQLVSLEWAGIVVGGGVIDGGELREGHGRRVLSSGLLNRGCKPGTAGGYSFPLLQKERGF